MKKAVLGSLLLSFAFVASACGSSTTSSNSASGSSAKSSSAKSPINLAVETDTTGGFSLIGISVEQGAKVAVDEINKNGGIGGHPINLKVYDAGASNDTAVSAMQQLLSDHPVAGVGFPVSTQALAVEPLLKTGGVPFVFEGGADQLTQEGVKAVFDAFPENNVNGTAAAKFIANNLHAKTVAIVYTDESYGQGGYKVFQQAFKTLGVTVVDAEPENLADSNYTAQLSKIKAKHPDAIIVWDQQNPMVLTLKEIQQLGIKSNVVCSVLIPASVKLLTPAAANGVYAVGELPGSKPGDAAFSTFSQEIQSAYNGAPDGYQATAYDGVHMLAAAIAKVGTGASQIEQYLLSMKSYQGVYGTYTAWPDGSLMHQTPVSQLNSQKVFKFVTSVNVPKS